MRNVPHSGTEPWRNKEHNQVWSFQTPTVYPFELDSPRHVEPNNLAHSQFFSPWLEFKGSVCSKFKFFCDTIRMEGETLSHPVNRHGASCSPCCKCDAITASWRLAGPIWTNAATRSHSSPEPFTIWNLESSSSGLFLAFILFQSDGPLGYSGCTRKESQWLHWNKGGIEFWVNCPFKRAPWWRHDRFDSTSSWDWISFCLLSLICLHQL